MQENGFLEEMLQRLQNAASKQEAEAYLRRQMSPAQNEKLEQILHDENAARDLLSTPQAQAILQKLTGEDAYGQHQ